MSACATVAVELTGADLLNAVREGIRQAGQQASPFRVGIAVGLAGFNLANPYPPGTRGANSFDSGVRFGKTKAARETERSAP